jgi:hypothetical protein
MSLSHGRRPAWALAASFLAAGLALAPAAHAGSGTRFIRSAVVNGDHTVTLPLLRGTSGGQTVWYVVLDASSSNAADRYGANRANKLGNARGTSAVQKVSVRNGVIDFPATVDFRPRRVVVPGPSGFPPAQADPGGVGGPGYSPLIELPDGTVLNAPQIANGTGHADKAVAIDTAAGTGHADKAVAIDTAAGTVRYALTDGFSRGERVSYVSTDASDPAVAALENSTYAPDLEHAPFAGGDGTDSARATLVAFVNGRTGRDNPQRQGLNSALLDGLDPLNVLAWKPDQGRYSPLWDVHPAEWSAGAVAARADVAQTSVDAVEDLVQRGTITGTGGTRFAPADVIVDCPIVLSFG